MYKKGDFCEIISPLESDHCLGSIVRVIDDTYKNVLVVVGANNYREDFEEDDYDMLGIGNMSIHVSYLKPHTM